MGKTLVWKFREIIVFNLNYPAPIEIIHGLTRVFQERCDEYPEGRASKSTLALAHRSRCRSAYNDWDLAGVLTFASNAPALGNDGRRAARQFRL
jgi:hypothetical protein